MTACGMSASIGGHGTGVAGGPSGSKRGRNAAGRRQRGEAGRIL